MSSTPFRLSAAVALTFIACLTSGCARSEVQLAGVEGTVTLDGQPLPNALVRFIPTAGGRTAFGKTDQQGHYKMLYTASADGAIVGPVRVEITTIDADNPKEFPEKLPAKYHSKSELTATVENRKNTLDFELFSK